MWDRRRLLLAAVVVWQATALALLPRWRKAVTNVASTAKDPRFRAFSRLLISRVKPGVQEQTDSDQVLQELDATKVSADNWNRRMRNLDPETVAASTAKHQKTQGHEDTVWRKITSLVKNASAFKSASSASSEIEIGIFWDSENVHVPGWCSATVAAECIRDTTTPTHGKIVERKLYFDSSKYIRQPLERSELDMSGFSLVDCPSRRPGRSASKETLDKKLIVDMLCFAWERISKGSSVRVVLISSDGDYAYTLARLRDIGVSTVVVYNHRAVANILIDVADEAITWEEGVLGGPPKPEATSLTIQKEAIKPTPSFRPAPGKNPTEDLEYYVALFLRAVLRGEEKSQWPYDFHTGEGFYRLMLPEKSDNKIYRKAKAEAIQRNYVDIGRKDLTRSDTPVIASPKFQEGKRSKDIHFQLTALGRATLDDDRVSRPSEN